MKRESLLIVVLVPSFEDPSRMVAYEVARILMEASRLRNLGIDAAEAAIRSGYFLGREMPDGSWERHGKPCPSYSCAPRAYALEDT
jgi:hypothetical protein